MTISSSLPVTSNDQSGFGGRGGGGGGGGEGDGGSSVAGTLTLEDAQALLSVDGVAAAALLCRWRRKLPDL